MVSLVSSRRALFSLSLLFSCLVLAPLPAGAIKFAIPASKNPARKCIWNAAHDGALVVITANLGPGENQRVDIEVVDRSEHQHMYLHKKNIRSETRLAITAHGEGDVGICFTNTLEGSVVSTDQSRVVDLDVDIGADAVDYNAIANQESLSGLETEMRKLEAVVQEITEEFGHLKRRELRMRDTNESTQKRVQNFAWVTILALVVLGVWQILHLRNFFRRKYLID
ncbi:vesicle coat component [Ceratobasidium sp. 414]|nr:vesicle coat component [Ceratobasidium sp. 414]